MQLKEGKCIFMFHFKIYFFLIVTFLCLPVVACIPKITHNLRDISVTPQLDYSSRSGKVPVDIEIYMSDEFKYHVFDITEEENFKGTIMVGKSLAMPFYNTISSLFNSVVLLEEYTPGKPASDEEARVILVPKIDNFVWDFIPLGPASKMKAALTLRCEFYDATGKQVHVISVSGERAESTVAMAFDGLNAVESAEKPTRMVVEDVLGELARRIMSERKRLETIH